MLDEANCTPKCNIFDLFLQMVTRTKKIFVGGLSAPSTLEDVKNYFEQFGRVSYFQNFSVSYSNSQIRSREK